MADLLGSFEQVILLAVLGLEDQAYGRPVLASVETALKRSVSAGAVYSTLDRLEAKNFVSSRLEEGISSRGGRARRYYRLTANGISALNDARATLETMWHGKPWPLEVRV